jgi:hypothetical protein
MMGAIMPEMRRTGKCALVFFLLACPPDFSAWTTGKGGIVKTFKGREENDRRGLLELLPE